MATVLTIVESKRGCGYRSSGANGYGIYLMGGELSAPCGLLPHVLTVCPCCGAGIKPARGWTWITPDLFGEPVDDGCGNSWCNQCPIGIGRNWQKAGLLWIGGKFYPDAHSFQNEARTMGISRKIAQIPHDFEIGETWVFFAHRKGKAWINQDMEEEWQPAIFSAFKPTHIDLVIDDPNDVPDYAERLQEKWGEEKVRIVKVVRDIDTQQEMDFDGERQRQTA